MFAEQQRRRFRRLMLYWEASSFGSHVRGEEWNIGRNDGGEGGGGLSFYG